MALAGLLTDATIVSVFDVNRLQCCHGGAGATECGVPGEDVTAPFRQVGGSELAIYNYYFSFQT